MDNQAKATPRPWKISSCEHNDNDIAQIIYGDIYGGGTIAELPKHKHLDCIRGKTAMYRNKGDKELAEANASLIVKAVNNHEALLEACREAKIKVDAFLNYDSTNKQYLRTAMETLSQAVANATK